VSCSENAITISQIPKPPQQINARAVLLLCFVVACGVVKCRGVSCCGNAITISQIPKPPQQINARGGFPVVFCGGVRCRVVKCRGVSMKLLYHKYQNRPNKLMLGRFCCCVVSCGGV
jgi:hypothetical protein